MKDNYQEFATTGLSIKWIPTAVQSIAGATGYQLDSMITYEDLVSPMLQTTTYEESVALSSFRQRYPRETWKTYMNNKPLAKDMNVDWMSTQADPNESENPPPGASIAVRIDGAGFQAQ